MAQVQRNIVITKEQKVAFCRIWFIYGNNGLKNTLLNHNAIQGFIEKKENLLELFMENRKNTVREDLKHIEFKLEKHWLTQECKLVCEYILKNEFEKAFEIANS